MKNNRNPYKANSCTRWIGPGIILGTLVLLIASVLFFFLAIPAIIENRINQETQLVEGSPTWKKWQDVTSHNAFIKFFIFNVTNTEEFKKGATAKMQEVGPYVYKEIRQKIILAIDDEEDTVTYKEIIHYYFQPEMSSGTEDDLVNIVNIPFISAAKRLSQKLYSFMANYAVDYLIAENESVVLEGLKIRNITFEGTQLHPAYQTFSDFGNVELPEQFQNGTFAFYNGKNGTASPEIKIYRGIKNKKDFGEIVTFDRMEEHNFWTNDSLPEGTPQYCNFINGSDGTLFPPFVTKDTVLYGFEIDICRSIYLWFESEVEYEGIPGWRFVIPEELLAGPHANPDNQCYCVDPDSDEPLDCYGGLMRLFTCKHGAPIMISRPHLLEGLPLMIEHVGLHPNKSIHETEIIIEPMSGSVLSVVKRLQVMVESKELPDIMALEGFYVGPIPAFWIEERGDMNEEGIADLRGRLINPLNAIAVAKWVVPGVLLVVIIAGIIFTVRNSRRPSPADKPEFETIDPVPVKG